MNEPIKILFADDDIDDRQIFAEAVKEIDESIKFYSTTNGQETIEFLQNADSELPDYIFLDLRMPKMSGRQCLKEIKKNERTQKIPVIIFTTSIDVEDEKELLNMGATHFLSKPVRPDEFYYLISNVINENWDMSPN